MPFETTIQSLTRFWNEELGDATVGASGKIFIRGRIKQKLQAISDDLTVLINSIP